MQKRLLHIYFVVIATILMLQLTSCSQDEISIQSSSPNIQVIGRIPNYNPYYVNTKADDNGKTVEESAIKYMALLTFDTSGKLIDTQQLRGSAAIFVIDRDILKEKATNRDLTKSSMYLIANIDQSQAAGWNIVTIDDLKNLVYKTSLTSVGIPSTGIPMIGKIENFDLSPDATIAGDKIQIELELLYAKIEFNLTLNATQIEPQTPSFYVRSCVAYNLPKGVYLVDNVNEATGQTIDYNNVIAEGINIPITGNRELTNMNSLAFTFYMPEHQVKPSKTGEQVYPAGISSDIEKQRYKPLLVEDGEGNYSNGKPAYVLINGIYTDHQDQEHLVTYKVYLGGNAINDFCVERNGRYVNDVTIKGITNSIDAAEGSVSLDHRVNVTRNDFIVFMEREAMLDSHFEVRPIRVRINSDENGDPKGEVTVSVADDCDWIRLEKKTSAPANDTKYCTNGKRKYFTTTLFENSDLGESTSCVIESNDDNCVWLYIDEYVEILTGLSGKTDEQIAAMLAEQQKKKRSAIITLTYTPANGGPTEVTEYQFIQRCIYPVMTTVNNPLYNRRNADGTPYIYYIEFFEEYLHNFDSNDGFGLTDYDGMPWGLEDLPISSEYQAAFIDESSKSFLLNVLDWLSIDTKQILNESIGTLETKPEYDFYLTRDKEEKGLPDEVTLRDYKGKDFTHEIMTVAKNNGKISTGTLDVEPESAAEYCYNKNKRDNNDLLSKENMHWYMPSIDEIEDIVTSAHFDFPVFQDNFYWSSQPAYIANDFIINVELWALLTTLKGSATGKYYNDNTNRARATKVEWGQTEPTKSGTNGSYGQQTYRRDWSNTTDNGYTEYSTSITFDDGNKARTDKCRVRAVYMP